MMSYLNEDCRVSESIIHSQKKIRDVHRRGVMTPTGHQDTMVTLTTVRNVNNI